MKESILRNNFAVEANGISSPQLLLWRPLIQDLITQELEVVYHQGSSLSVEDNEIVQGISEESLRVEKLEPDALPDSIEWILFSNTADKINHIDPKLNQVNRACFFGGMTSPNLGKQIETAIDLNINTLGSDDD